MNRYILESSFWLGLRSEESLECLVNATVGGEANIFSVDLTATSRGEPVEAVYALAGRASGSPRRRLCVSFTWSHQGGSALPTMSGEILARRFGPFATINVRARYLSEDDAAARLFHEAIGGRIARSAFAALLTAIELLLTPQARPHAERSALR